LFALLDLEHFFDPSIFQKGKTKQKKRRVDERSKSYLLNKVSFLKLVSLCVMHLEEDSQIHAFYCCLECFLFQSKAVCVVLGNKIGFTEGM